LAYRLVITGAARKDLDQLPKDVLERADPKILALAETPTVRIGKAPRFRESLYRIRVGKYRVIYEIDKSASTVTVA